MKNTLTKGNKPILSAFIFTGWTEGDGSGHAGYHVDDYFRDGVYLGPDEHGIEPTVTIRQSLTLMERVEGSKYTQQVEEWLQELCPVSARVGWDFCPWRVCVLEQSIGGGGPGTASMMLEISPPSTPHAVRLGLTFRSGHVTRDGLPAIDPSPRHDLEQAIENLSRQEREQVQREGAAR